MERLVIDYREKAIIQGLEKLSIPHQKENLAIGDFFCYFPNEFQICMERKTWQDLWASIIDGRYREQRSRLLEWMQDNHKVIYILEGEPNSIGDNKDTCLRTIHRLSLLYNITVWRTKSVEDTVEYLKWFYQQKTMFEKLDPLQCQITQLSDSMVKKKKDVQNPKNFLQAILQSITGVSYDIAKQIVPHDCQDLKSFLTETESLGIEQFSTIPLDTKNGKSRKIGFDKAKRIFEILGIPYQEPVKKTSKKKDKGKLTQIPDEGHNKSN